MTDSSDPEAKPLSPQKATWSETFYGIATWPWNTAWSVYDYVTSSGTDSEPEVEEDEDDPVAVSPAQALLTALTSPRPANLTAPESAAQKDKDAVNRAYDELLDYLRGDAPDLEEANVRRGALEVLVAKVITDTALARRKALFAKVGAVQAPLDCTADEQRALAKTRATLLGKIKSAKTLDALDDLESRFDTDLQSYKDAVTEIGALVAARNQVLGELAAFKTTRTGLAKEVDRGFYQFLISVENDVAAAIPGVTKASDFPAQSTKLSDALAKVGDARAYAADYDEWSRDTSVYAASITDQNDAKEVKEHRDGLADAAAKKAAAGNFAGARTELAKFDSHAKVNGATYGDAVAFAKALQAIQDHPAIKKMNSLNLPGSGTVNGDFSQARKKGAVNLNYSDAVTDLNGLKPALDRIDAICDLWVIFKPVADADPHGAVGTKFNAASGMCRSRDWQDALDELNGIDPNDRKSAGLKARLKKLKKEAQPLLVSGNATAHAHVKTFLDDADNKIGTGDLDDAGTALDSARGALDDILPWADLKTQAALAKAQADASDTFKLLDTANSLAAGHEYKKAATALRAAIASYAELGTYTQVRAQLELAKAAFAADTDEFGLADTALGLAETEALAANVAGAITTLRTAIVALGDAAVEAGIWLKRLGPVEKRHTKVKAGLSLPKVIKLLDDSLQAAKTAAETDRDYAKATAALTTHEALLKDAAEYAALRPRVANVKAALDRAVNQLSGIADIETKLYGHTDDSLMTAEISAADDKATDGKMREARDDYRSMLTTWQGYLTLAATEFEKADSVGSNAGHSIGRHGPQIDEEDLLARLTTGIAADGKKSTTQKSSKFASIEAWMEGRELSAAYAETQTHPDGSFVDLGAPSIPADENATIDIRHEVEHSGPIDEAFVGIKPAMALGGKNKIVEGDTYETYEKLTGITKSQALWLFEIDWSGITAGKPSKSRDQTPKEYITRYKAENGGTAPADIPGKWVMMQLFPIVDNWDQELQEYV